MYFSLIQKQSRANKKVMDNNISTALHTAIQHGNNNILDNLLELKPLLNDKDIDGNTALHYAIITRNKIAAKALVEIGANPNIKNNDNKTALKIAQERDDHEMIKILLPRAPRKVRFYNKNHVLKKITKPKPKDK